MSAITVVGLVPGGYTIEDIRVSVPHHEAVQIPAHLVDRSKSLIEALQGQRIMQLGGPLPAAPAQRDPPVLAPPLRGRGIAPHNPVAQRQDTATWPRERDALVRELEASRAQSLQLQAVNQTLQETLTNMAAQLTLIQKAVTDLSAGRESVPMRLPSLRPRQPEPTPTFLDEAVPHFIPATAGAVAEVRISVPESTSDSDLTEARGALRSLRKAST